MNGRSHLPALALGVASTIGGIYVVLTYQWRIASATDAEKDARERDAQMDLGARSIPLGPTSRASGIRSGEVQLHYEEGFSFDRHEIVRPDSASADVVFVGPAGGVASVRLEAPRGILALSSVRAHRGGSTTPTLALFESIVAVDPREIELSTEEPANDRDPERNVFVVQTLREGWAKLVIVDRTDVSDREKSSITVRYVFNAREPIFEPGAKESRMLRGFRLRD